MMMTWEAGLMVGVGWLFGDDQFCLISFFFILFYWYAPWGGKCHHGPRCACLLGGRLIGLAFDPLAHSEGWGDGSHGSTRGRPPLLSPPLYIPLIPSSLLPPSFIYPLCCYISLTVLFLTQVPLKFPTGEAWFSRFKAFHCAKSHINGWQLKTSTY